MTNNSNSSDLLVDDTSNYIALYKQKPKIIDTNGEGCPNNTWEISGATEKEDIICSVIDTNFCKNINPQVEVSWAHLDTNENGMVSRDGLVKCEWPAGVLTNENLDKIKSSGAIVGKNDGNLTCQITPEFCLMSQNEKCPIDIYRTGEEMVKCTVLTAVNNGIGIKGLGECKSCNIKARDVYDKAIPEYCDTNPTSPDCMCILPDESLDPVLSKSYKNGTIYSEMPLTLKNERGTWYLPCNGKNYMKTSDLTSNKSQNVQICTILETYLQSTGIDYTDLKSRTTCYDSKGNFKPLYSPPDESFIHRYWWVIVLLVIIILVIIFLIVGNSSKSKNNMD